MDIRIVDGRLTKDAEVKTNTKTGQKFLAISLANNGFVKGVQTTTYFNVISYDQHLIQKHESENFYTKGKLLIVSGRPSEVMTIKDNKTYLNRNILANSIELGYIAKQENATQSTTTTYRDVAPIGNIPAPTCEIPVVSQPQVSTPSVAVTSPTVNVVPTPAPSFNDVPSTDDDLPF